MNYCWDVADIIDIKSEQVVCSAFTKNFVKYFEVIQNFAAAKTFVASTYSNDSERKKLAILWHRRLAHASAKIMTDMSKHVIDFLVNLKIRDDDFKD